ncbi:hypothetical protein EV715DRAFT_254425 [Schizophyllum commune]
MMLSSAFVLASLAASALAAPAAANSARMARDVFPRRLPFKGPGAQNTPSLSRRVIEPTTWDPPANLTQPLEEVWQHEMETYSDPLGFKNYGFDQVIANNGKINYCVRWESTKTSTEADRATIAEALQRSVGKWMEWLYGYDSFPYAEVPVSVVGWAVKDVNLLEGDTSGFEVYTDVDADGIPQCAESCGRFFHQDNDYSGCAAGADKHYDMSLWLTDGMGETGAGGDWGQRVGSEYFLETMNEENVHIVLHELGHTFALDDFYDWTPTGITNFIMLAGSSTVITDFDGWMLRDWWTNLKDRYELSAVANATAA